MDINEMIRHKMKHGGRPTIKTGEIRSAELEQSRRTKNAKGKGYRKGCFGNSDYELKN